MPNASSKHSPEYSVHPSWLWMDSKEIIHPMIPKHPQQNIWIWWVTWFRACSQQSMFKQHQCKLSAELSYSLIRKAKSTYVITILATTRRALIRRSRRSSRLTKCLIYQDIIVLEISYRTIIKCLHQTLSSRIWRKWKWIPKTIRNNRSV